MTDTLKPAELDLEALKLDAKDCANRLRGKYAIGPIMTNGEPEFGWRMFDKVPVTLLAGSSFPAIYSEAAGTIEALLTRIEALEAERDELKLAICGGEDAPGYAASLSNEKILQVLKDNYASWKRDSELAWDGETANTWKARTLSAEAQRDRMREALEPFADQADCYEDSVPDYVADWPMFKVHHFRKARAALSQGTGGSSGAGE